MSKKWKDKFKKQQKARLIREAMMGSATPSVSSPEPVVKQSSPVKTFSKPTFSQPKTVKPTLKEQIQAEIKGQQPDAQDTFLPEVAIVKHDMRNIGYVIGSILILLIAATIFDHKTGWILTTADFFFKQMP